MLSSQHVRVRMLSGSSMSLPYFTDAGKPTRAESVEAIQLVSDEFRTQLFSESGIACYRKQVDGCRKRLLSSFT